MVERVVDIDKVPSSILGARTFDLKIIPSRDEVGIFQLRPREE